MLAENFSKGFLLGGGLIIAIGAQNAFILALGLKRQHAFKAALVCALSDAALIIVGVAGLGALISQSHIATNIAAIGGAAFLIGYALLALRRAAKPQVLEATTMTPPGWGTVLAQTLAVTFLNPHVYLDTVVMLGAVSAQINLPFRYAFAAGAVVASFSWFFALATSANLMAPYLARPITWRLIDVGTAAIMLFIAWKLIAPFF